MKSADQYYSSIINDLEEIATMALASAKQMRASVNNSLDNRAQPINLADIRTTVANAERMCARYDTLAYMSIENVSYDIATDETWVKPVGKPSVKTRDSNGKF